jgi:hypothetical protein
VEIIGFLKRIADQVVDVRLAQVGGAGVVDPLGLGRVEFKV